MKRWAWFLAMVVLFATATAHAETVCLIKVEGVIGPATAGYISRAVDEAASRGAQCLIIQLDTPGGLLDPTKEIVQKFLASTVPTIVYVAPQGAQAGSAGCFITLAADVAAMAPATAIGAAHPVEMGGGEIDKTMKEKLENFYSSYIESIAVKRKRNAEWARSSVRDSASTTAEKALQMKVIDFIAKDREDLLKQLDGREVNSRKLKTAAATVVEIPLSLREKVFQAIAHPQMMLVLTLIVMYGIIGELTSPGAILPGVAGVIALVLLLYLATALPMNVAGLVLLGVAIALFLIDAFAPTHGILTAGGIVAFFLGALMLFDRSNPYLRLSLAWVVPATVVTALFFIFVVGAGLRAQRMPVKAGAETMRGKVVTALTAIDGRGGKVFVEGEYWQAVSDVPVEQGQRVEIVERQGLTLRVKPKTT
jgi:membrane-bound serine protease (ClpP class)